MRKVWPLQRALGPFEAQVTGRKRFQTRERADMQAVEFHDQLLDEVAAYDVKNRSRR